MGMNWCAQHWEGMGHWLYLFDKSLESSFGRNQELLEGLGVVLVRGLGHSKIAKASN